jgi:hypothetical protein
MVAGEINSLSTVGPAFFMAADLSRIDLIEKGFNHG